MLQQVTRSQQQHQTALISTLMQLHSSNSQQLMLSISMNCSQVVDPGKVIRKLLKILTSSSLTMFHRPHKTNRCKIRTSRLAAWIHLAITQLQCRFQVNSSPNNPSSPNSCPTQWATRSNNKTWWWWRCSRLCNNSSKPTWWCNSSNRCKEAILLQQGCKVPIHLWLIPKPWARMLLAHSHSSRCSNQEDRCPSTIRIKCKAIIHLVRCEHDGWMIYIHFKTRKYYTLH